jgi:TatD DNase family protein
VRWPDDPCHLEPDPQRAAAQVAAAAEAGVERMISVGCDVAQSAAYVDAARRHPGAVWATAGVHPPDA